MASSVAACLPKRNRAEDGRLAALWSGRYAASCSLSMLKATQIAALQTEATSLWHRPGGVGPAPDPGIDCLVLEQHQANFDLWHREDAARDPRASDAEIAAVKRAIDSLNQRRNDLMESIDLLLLSAAEQNSRAPLHSESPGLIIDRLSILALKCFHTAEESTRADAGEDHRRRNLERLALLGEQRADLTACLGGLWTEIVAGSRRFKLYRQLKMYNDPTLNPVLYSVTGRTSSSKPSRR